MTCDASLTRDVVNLFHYLTGHARVPQVSFLLVAPFTMRPRFLELIHRRQKTIRLGNLLDVYMRDLRQAWGLDINSAYTQLQPDTGPGPEGLDSHRILMQSAHEEKGDRNALIVA